MTEIEVEVLVVGAGPSGLTAALALARHGVKVMAISKYRGPANTPRAHITNQRTLEVFKDLGIEERIRSAGWPLSYLSHNVLATSLAGLEIARYRSYGTGPDRLSEYALASPCPPINCQQHVMEPILRDAVIEQGADVRYGYELVEISQTADLVTARIVERDTGEELIVRARYAIGADGGRSTVAEKLGFSFVGEPGLRNMVTSWLEVDLTRYVEHRPGVLYWIGRPGHEQWFGTASWACVKPFTEWLMVQPWSDPDVLPSEAEVIDRARLTIDDGDVPIKVKSIGSWQVNNVVATNYRNGSVFISGDAAHRHPPAGGLGTNTSVQDAFNLAWKLAYVLRGKAGPGLLDSYSAERQPVGAHVVSRANVSFENTAALVSALGFTEGQSEADGWEAIRSLYSDEPGASERRDVLEKAVKLQDYRSNALGVDLGQRYASGAVIAESGPFPEPLGDPELHYRPTSHSGAPLPHAWVEHDGKQLSTLDITGHGNFSLLVGVGGTPWKQAAEQVATRLGIELPVREVGLRCAYDDVNGDWKRAREIGDHGAILVRPDRFVAWRALAASSTPEVDLEAALRQILDRPA
ncbi:MAG: FAD-dependent monooxygenase [Sphingobium sp.]|uniref:FAD-dependent monooxygenase n=1 Tax=Sphingobium sp. TaxID=1912891 RepID=UPI0029B8A335|nr:FAD-dependent monooxygenase [Sphingobium sp.]MDX3911575.1 FAD-dependent monooxygenase [Sphingobium sp.]